MINILATYYYFYYYFFKISCGFSPFLVKLWDSFFLFFCQFIMTIFNSKVHCVRYYREGSHCEKCDRSCERCTGPGPESCRACSPPLLELQGTKLCVEHCPHRFYQLDDICKQCHTSCQTCTGTDMTSSALF